MSDIGLTGISTTSLNKVGPNGETLSGNNFPGLDAFGGSGPKVGINEFGEQIKEIDVTSAHNSLRSLTSGISGLVDNLFGRKQADLKYPLETEDGAYQARVTFRMFSFQPNKPGDSQKNFEKIATDNNKNAAAVALSSDQQGQLLVDDFRQTSTGNPGVGNEIVSTNYGNAGIGNEVSAAPASGSGATTANTATGQLKATAGDIGTKIADSVRENSAIQTAFNTLSGGITPQRVQNANVVDMYFPLTMQFNDNAQYDNASLGALGAGVEAALQGGAGVLEAAISEAGKSFKSAFDVIRGNDDLEEAAFRVGAARAIDKASFLSSGVANALTLQNRVIVNPNVRALFRGVGLREFTFQFKMIARSQREAEEVRRIVKHFRTEMYPDVYKIDEADIGFKFPNLFEISFSYNGITNRKIPKINYCYLRTVSTTVNPTGGAMRRDGQPNEIDLTLSFVEYKTLNREDIEEGGY